MNAVYFPSTEANVTAISTYNSFGGIGWLADLKPNILNKIDVIPGDISDEVFINNTVVYI